jgi:hypothetical protein
MARFWFLSDEGDLRSFWFRPNGSDTCQFPAFAQLTHTLRGRGKPSSKVEDCSADSISEATVLRIMRQGARVVGFLFKSTLPRPTLAS